MSEDRGAELRGRTKNFALAVIRLCSQLPKSMASQIIARQVLRSGTSVGANYREACRARSKAEFISKLHIVLQELGETEYWLELLEEANIVRPEAVNQVKQEANELTAIFISSVKTTSSNRTSKH